MHSRANLFTRVDSLSMIVPELWGMHVLWTMWERSVSLSLSCSRLESNIHLALGEEYLAL